MGVVIFPVHKQNVIHLPVREAPRGTAQWPIRIMAEYGAYFLPGFDTTELDFITKGYYAGDGRIGTPEFVQHFLGLFWRRFGGKYRPGPLKFLFYSFLCLFLLREPKLNAPSPMEHLARFSMAVLRQSRLRSLRGREEHGCTATEEGNHRDGQNRQEAGKRQTATGFSWGRANAIFACGATSFFPGLLEIGTTLWARLPRASRIDRHRAPPLQVWSSARRYGIPQGKWTVG